MMQLPERARRRLELAGSELPPHAQSYFLRRDAVNWGIVAIMLLLLLASIAVSVSMASGKGELRDEVAELREKWAYDLGRADQAEAELARFKVEYDRREAHLDEITGRINAMMLELHTLELVRWYAEHGAGAGDDELRRMLGLDADPGK